MDMDGRKVYDSVAILNYILAKFDQKEVYAKQKDLLKKAQNEAWLGLSQHIDRPYSEMNPTQLKNAPIFYQDPMFSDSEAKDVILRYNGYLKHLEEIIPPHAYLNGLKISVADIYLYNEVYNNVTILKMELVEFPKVKGWMERIQSDDKIGDENAKFIKALETIKQINETEKPSEEQE